MTFKFEELKSKTVAQLRDIAKEIQHEAVQGYTQLNKEHLLAAICQALNIDMHVHHEVVGLDKTKIKREIRELKAKRDETIKAKDHDGLKRIRRKLKKLKNTLRKATV